MIQSSLFPDEVPDKILKDPGSRRQDYFRWLRRYLATEGHYKFAQMALQIKEASEESVLHYHKISKEELYGMCEAVFGESIVWQETIQSFLERTHNETNYSLTKYIMKDEKDSNRKRTH